MRLGQVARGLLAQGRLKSSSMRADWLTTRIAEAPEGKLRRVPAAWEKTTKSKEQLGLRGNETIKRRIETHFGKGKILTKRKLGNLHQAYG